MEQSMYNRAAVAGAGALLFITFSCLSFSGCVDAYKNYTVGDSMGWYDNTEKPVNYQKWAAGKNFSLGDFLFFNTDSNHTVVQTYNATIYKLCDNEDSSGNDTIEWSATDPSNTAPQQVTVQVPLLKEGVTYFFSSDYDGDQCRNGMHFQINVTHGKGLPESLKDPSEQAPAPNAADYDSTPETEVSYDFSHPHDDESQAKKDSGSISLHKKLIDMKLHGIFLFFGVLFLR